MKARSAKPRIAAEGRNSAAASRQLWAGLVGFNRATAGPLRYTRTVLTVRKGAGLLREAWLQEIRRHGRLARGREPALLRQAPPAVMSKAADDLVTQAIYQSVEIVPYDSSWPAEYEAQRKRLMPLFPATFSDIEHVGSTAVAGLAAKPVVDVIAAVSSMDVADDVTRRLVGHGYLFSAEFNAKLGDSRWLMKRSNGRRTHHLHLVLSGSRHWLDKIRFRDLLRADASLANRYLELKRALAQAHSGDREAYTEAKSSFVGAALAEY